MVLQQGLAETFHADELTKVLRRVGHPYPPIIVINIRPVCISVCINCIIDYSVITGNRPDP
jgi:hypothetical protein